MIDQDRLYQTIGQKLKAVRKDNQQTQAGMAEILGLERTSVTNIERGKQRPGIHVLYRCCEYFEIPIAEFLPSIERVTETELPPLAQSAFESAVEKTRQKKRVRSDHHEETINADTETN